MWTRARGSTRATWTARVPRWEDRDPERPGDRWTDSRRRMDRAPRRRPAGMVRGCSLRARAWGGLGADGAPRVRALSSVAGWGVDDRACSLGHGGVGGRFAGVMDGSPVAASQARTRWCVSRVCLLGRVQCLSRGCVGGRPAAPWWRVCSGRAAASFSVGAGRAGTPSRRTLRLAAWAAGAETVGATGGARCVGASWVRCADPGQTPRSGPSWCLRPSAAVAAVSAAAGGRSVAVLRVAAWAGRRRSSSRRNLRGGDLVRRSLAGRGWFGGGGVGLRPSGPAATAMTFAGNAEAAPSKPRSRDSSGVVVPRYSGASRPRSRASSLPSRARRIRCSGRHTRRPCRRRPTPRLALY